MIGGSVRFGRAYVPDEMFRKPEESVTERTKNLIQLVKHYGRIELRDLAKILGISCHVARMSVANATFVPGSLIYEDMVKGQTVIGWME